MAKELQDNVSRTKRFNFLGVATFVGLRSSDVYLQYGLLQFGWGSQLLQKLGGEPLSPFVAGGTNLSLYYKIVAAMALGSSLKQNLTMLYVSEQDTPIASAVTISLFNTIFNSLNTLFALWDVTSQKPASANDIWGSPLVVAGAGLYLIGILTEFVSEVQRTIWKRNPANKGKAYSGGLFSLARHINYGGYTIWRGAYALTTGGWPWALVVASFFFWDFKNRGVPVLDKYLSERYGEAYQHIKERVPYLLIPWIY